MTHTRAQAGGEMGVNGEFYQGGQFLPSSPTTEKGAFKQSKRRKGTGKQEIEPYKWEVGPTETAKSIFGMVSGTYVQKNSSGNFERYEPFIKYQAKNYYNSTGQKWDETLSSWHIDELIEMYNSGERWIEPR